MAVLLEFSLVTPIMMNHVMVNDNWMLVDEFTFVLIQVQMKLIMQNSLKLVTMMLVMARMLKLFVNSVQFMTTSYKYRSFILKEENFNSQSSHGDKLETITSTYLCSKTVFLYL